MSYQPEEIAAVYALDAKPKLYISPSTALGLYWNRPYREYRIVPAPRPQSSTQLSLFGDA